MYDFELDEENLPRAMLASEMKVGDLAEVQDSVIYAGCVLLRTYSELVNLRNPRMTWDNPGQVTLPVRLLPPWTVVTLTVRENGA